MTCKNMTCKKLFLIWWEKSSTFFLRLGMAASENDGYPVVGILTGISYVSGLHYFRAITETFSTLATGKAMAPNPPILLFSTDCDPYVVSLLKKDWEEVIQILVTAVTKIADRCDFLCFASNTAHMAYYAVQEKFPSTPILHIADVTAASLKEKNIKKVGLLGTEATMRESYLKDRLSLHGIATIVPHEQHLSKIFEYIVNELSFHQFSDECRSFFIGRIEEMVQEGAQGVILGCTEIELLELEPHLKEPNKVPMFRSAELHIAAIASVQAKKAKVSDFFPPSPSQ